MKKKQMEGEWLDGREERAEESGMKARMWGERGSEERGTENFPGL